MSIRQEGGVINIKYQCHKATRTLNITQKSSLADAIFVPSGLKIVPDPSIARDGFMILMLRIFQFSALSRGNRLPNLPYKKIDETYLGEFGLHQLLPENSATFLLEPSFLNIHISLKTVYILQVSFHNQL